MDEGKREEIYQKFRKKKEENEKKNKELAKNYSEVIGMDRMVIQVGFNLDDLETQSRVMAAALSEISKGFSNAADIIALSREASEKSPKKGK